MAFDVDQDPYRRLRAIVSERTRALMIWTGAGLSVPAGLPDWRRLRESLSEAMKRKAATLDKPGSQELLALDREIEREGNPWIAFQRIEHAVGRTSFVETVREQLRPAANCAIPETYRLLWLLRPSGMITLNLDRLSTRAFHEAHASRAVTEFTGKTASGFTHVLQGMQSFVLNLHGIGDDASSWVFTHVALHALLKDSAYLNFLSAALSSHVNVFVGLSADDVAVGGHLARLADAGIDAGQHFWLSSRTDIATDRWSERAGIQMIRYRTTIGDHSELTQLLDDLRSFVPEDSTEGLLPVVSSFDTTAETMMPPSELAKQEPERVREILNRRAREILAHDSADAVQEFERFVTEYDEAVHRAWYVSTIEGKNKVLGYTLVKEEAKGAFGRVYRAYGENGEPVAIKVLHSDLREQHALLLAFRRGVRSMNILGQRGVHGVVKYIDASEIPAFVVMEWIEGANLSAAVAAGRFGEWADVLRVARGISSILSSAHAVPERVLHRDIRPANIMLEGFWTGDDWRVVLLDFDLSWHRGAYEQSVVHGSGTAGYLAPEQIIAHRDESTRHAAVDSFGLGMTLFFVVGGKDPVPAQHRHGDWKERVAAVCRSPIVPTWRSLPARYARLIANATMDRQAERLDLNQINTELERLSSALERPELVAAADLLAEEIAARAEYASDYVWNEDEVAARLHRPSGLKIAVGGDETRQRVTLRLEWSTVGLQDRKLTEQWLPEATKVAAAALGKANWVVTLHDVRSQQLQIVAEVSTSLAAERIDGLSAGLDKAVGHIRFDRINR